MIRPRLPCRSPTVGLSCAKPIFMRALPLAGYARPRVRQYRFVSPLRGVHYRVMLVALVQRIIGAFHENFRPLNERGGQKTAEGAEDDFLKKRGLHRRF